MSDASIGFLYKAASTLLRTEKTQTQNILRSYYLTRCMQITKGYGLPEKHFSSNIRCPHCCIEWGKHTETKIKPIKLSKRQKKRIKSQTPTKKNRDPKSLLHSNELERICSFCKHGTVTPLIKPNKEAVTKKRNKKAADIVISKHNLVKSKVKTPAERKTETSIYCNAREVYSLSNKNNALTNAKETKVIKNNKRKKDKFAGLCQQAVLTSAKLKEIKNAQSDKKAKTENKLLAFLKTSS
ncbi:hypothetical protein MSG28_014192 [Choristoneura fumiferana]|uniref:Uncharacterized protein n=1 Tax=Choristoneura fumiferana TaxID=7141 RepID=A0ACC0JG92_CHOFU|nr:hypothetical protein MSG28_014192 [Choristoneura fumiferana]